LSQKLLSIRLSQKLLLRAAGLQLISLYIYSGFMMVSMLILNTCIGILRDHGCLIDHYMSAKFWTTVNNTFIHIQGNICEVHKNLVANIFRCKLGIACCWMTIQDSIVKIIWHTLVYDTLSRKKRKIKSSSEVQLVYRNQMYRSLIQIFPKFTTDFTQVSDLQTWGNSEHPDISTESNLKIPRPPIQNC
jgi:hypothetical protein